jgi:EAL domain-containing protein (putative c-di-GMP-specific phosphodiesterase class I)
MSIAVNVSAVQLKAPSLLADVQDALEQSQIDPSRVVLEITEHSLVEDSQTVIGVLEGLKKLGVRLAIDDFGTGYASLSYLQRMPVDILKIDQSFVQSCAGDARGRELLEAIFGIGRSLSLETIAEGVEQPAQLELVRDMGCDLVQGFLLGRPLPLDEVRRLISSPLARGTAPSAERAPADGVRLPLP